MCVTACATQTKLLLSYFKLVGGGNVGTRANCNGMGNVQMIGDKLQDENLKSSKLTLLRNESHKKKKWPQCKTFGKSFQIFQRN